MASAAPSDGSRLTLEPRLERVRVRFPDRLSTMGLKKRPTVGGAGLRRRIERVEFRS